jgi:hypothetical protein
MWKANGKTTTLQLFLDSLSPKTEKLSLEGTMDLSRDRLIPDYHLIVMRGFVSGKNFKGYAGGKVASDASALPDRRSVRCRTKTSTLVYQIGACADRLVTSTAKINPFRL